MGIQQAIQVLEEWRRRRLRLWRILMLLPFAALIVVVAFMVRQEGNPFMIPIILCSMVFLGMPILLKYQEWTKEFKALYKKVFAKEVIQELVEDAVYVGDKGFSRQEVDNMGVIEVGNYLSTEDYLKGTHNGVTFELSDVYSESRAGAGSNRHSRLLFKGLILRLTVPNQYTEAIQVYSRSFRHRVSIRFSMKTVNPEDEDFRDMFHVESENEQEALQVLTPRFMNCLKGLAERYDSVGLFLYKDQLYLALGTQRDLFDGSLYQAIDYQREMNRMREDVKSIKDVIDALEISEAV